MEAQISKKDLLRGLARTHAVADRKSSMPILSNVLVTAADGRLHFAATDLYLAASASADAKVKKPGNVATSAKKLFDIVKNLPEGEVVLKADANALHLRCGKVKFKLPAMPGEDFPPLPSPREATFVELDSVALKELVTLTSYAMCSDDTRPHLSGTFFESDGKTVRMVTTDGHRLAKAEFAAEVAPFSMLVPDRGITELKKLLEDVRPAVSIATSGGCAFFRGSDVDLSVKLADETFPPYQKVIPGSHQRRAIASREALSDCLRRMSAVAGDKGNGVRMKLSSGSLAVEGENPDSGEGSDEIDVDFAGESLTIGANVRYLLETLSSVPDDEIALEFGGELDPMVVRPVADSRFTAVVMPMRA